MSTVDDESGQDRIDKGHSDDARSADDASSHDVPGLLDAAVAATRAANSAVAVCRVLLRRPHDPLRPRRRPHHLGRRPYRPYLRIERTRMRDELDSWRRRRATRSVVGQP